MSNRRDAGIFVVLAIFSVSLPLTQPVAASTYLPTSEPTHEPTLQPTTRPTSAPTLEPSSSPSIAPSLLPTAAPTLLPSAAPSLFPTHIPTIAPYNVSTISSAVILQIPVGKCSYQLRMATRATILHVLPFVTTMDQISLPTCSPLKRAASHRLLAAEIIERTYGSYSNISLQESNHRRRLQAAPSISVADVDKEYGCGDDIHFKIIVTGVLSSFCSSLEVQILNELGSYQGVLAYLSNTEGTHPYTYMTASPYCTGTGYLILVYCSLQYQAYSPSNFTITVEPTASPTVQPSFMPTILPSVAPTISQVPTLSIYPTTEPTPAPTILDTVAINFKVTVAIGATSMSKLGSKTTLRKEFAGAMVRSVTTANFSKTLKRQGRVFNVTNVHLNNKTCIENLTIARVESAVITSIVQTYIAPSAVPTLGPTSQPSLRPTLVPSSLPSVMPTDAPSLLPSVLPSPQPSFVPTLEPTTLPTTMPTMIPTALPTITPTSSPSGLPTLAPTPGPTGTPRPSVIPSASPTLSPTLWPTAIPSVSPTADPSPNPSLGPSAAPTILPSLSPSSTPSLQPTSLPSLTPTFTPTGHPTLLPTSLPTSQPSTGPTVIPSAYPTPIPSIQPSQAPTTTSPTVFPTVGPHTFARASASITLESASFSRPADFTESHEKAFAVALVTSSSYLTATAQVCDVNATRWRNTRGRSLLTSIQLSVKFTIQIILEEFGMSKADDSTLYSQRLMLDIGLDIADAIVGNSSNQRFDNAFNSACRARGVDIYNVSITRHSLRDLASSVYFYNPVPSNVPSPVPTSTKQPLGDSDSEVFAALKFIYVGLGVVGTMLIACALVFRSGTANEFENVAKKTKISQRQVAAVLDSDHTPVVVEQHQQFSLVAFPEFESKERPSESTMHANSKSKWQQLQQRLAGAREEVKENSEFDEHY